MFNGVLIQDDSIETNLTGKAGYYLFQQLHRVGIERDAFSISNSISTLDLNIIAAHKVACAKAGLTPVIVALGKAAFAKLLDIPLGTPIFKADYQAYPIWSEHLGVWIFATDHPFDIQRGNHHLAPILQFIFKRAIEVARDGLKLEKHDSYLLDPLPVHFTVWAREYLAAAPGVVLSYDIETPYKQGEDEETVAREEDSDFSIIRCSFCYRPGFSVSVPWTAPYRAAIESIFASNGAKVGWNSRGYDDERILASGIKINGDRLDAMLGWHVLNSSLPKGLGFVTPFYWQNTSMWKHLSQQLPAFYNAKDADAALRNWIGIEKDLRANSQWEVFDRHVIKLNRVFDYMSSKGVPLDQNMRNEAEVKLSGLLTDTETQIESLIPDEARRIAHIYKNTPRDTDGLLIRKGYRDIPTCPGCGINNPPKSHYKTFKKKLNSCGGLVSKLLNTEIDEYYRLAEWKISKNGLLDYQRVFKQQPVIDRKSKKITFDENAIIKLMKRYPKDALYPLVLDFRGNQKLLSTYIGVTQPNGKIKGGMPLGADGNIHATFTTDPSTLRSSCRRPNLQNLPRPKGPNDLATIIRNLVVASPGCTFLARDYSGIEAVLVGYEAGLPDYIRLAKMDVHSYYTAYALHELDGRVSGNDLPLLSWDDDKLKASLDNIKANFKADRNNLYKHLVHGANFFQGAKGAQEKILDVTGIAYPVATVKRVMDIYFDLFPGIRKWHQEEMLRAERDGFTRNAFGYVHRFSKVFDYEADGTGGFTKSPGPQANQVIAFKPQSNAAGIIKEAMLRLYNDRFEEAGQFLRLLVHDELFNDVLNEDVERVDRILREEMEKPIPELALPASWGMGTSLIILTEAKSGNRWGGMH